MSQRFSHSRLDTYRQCPRKYQFAYVDKTEVEEKPHASMVSGNVLHHCLHQLYKHRENARLLTLEELMAIFVKEWEKYPLDSLRITGDFLAADNFIERSRKALESFYHKYQPFDEGQILKLEDRITASLDDDGLYKVHGVIDRLMMRADGVVEIVDYKYKAEIPRQSDLDRDHQMGLYHLAVAQSWPQFERIEVRQVYLRQEQEFRTHFTPDTLDEFRSGIIDEIREIRRAAVHSDFPVRESALCSYCKFVTLCPAFTHKKALDVNDPDPVALDTKKLATDYLKIDHRIKKLEGEKSALRDRVIAAAQSSGFATLIGEGGKIKITSRAVEKFPSKSDDPATCRDITDAVRLAHENNPGYGLDSYFELNLRELHKSGYAKEALPEDLMKTLAGHLVEAVETKIFPRFEDSFVGEDEDGFASNGDRE